MNPTDEAACAELRRQIFITGYKGGMAHLASCFSSVEMLYTLYCKDVLRLDPSNPKWPDRDRFILSKGHAGLALYTVLCRAGLIPPAQVASYLTEESFVGGEPCMRDSEWVEATTGSLGHGLSMAVGIAIALKMNHSPAKVYCMLGDGECEEGTVWEAAASAVAFKLDNLIAILDDNEIQKMDFTKNIIGEPHWQQKWEAFGWAAIPVDGHDTDAFKAALSAPKAAETPTVLLAHTVKGKGVSLMENNVAWHFRLPGKKELRVFKAELGIQDKELE